MLASADKAAYNVVVVLKDALHPVLQQHSVIDRHQCHIWSPAKFGVLADENHEKLHTLYWLYKPHISP